jgi:hypothetical protein
MKIICKKYENNVISQFHIVSTCFPYYVHIFFTFLGSGPRSGPRKSILFHIPGHICFILFYIFVYAWAGALVHSAIFESCEEELPPTERCEEPQVDSNGGVSVPATTGRRCIPEAPGDQEEKSEEL